MSATPSATASPSDAFAGIEATAAGVGKVCAAVLDPKTRQLLAETIRSAVANTIEPKGDAATRDLAGRIVGGFLGGMAAPGMESSEHVLEEDIENRFLGALDAPATPMPPAA
jgi:hypothetical protein